MYNSWRQEYNEVLRYLELLTRVSRDRQSGPLVSPALNNRLNEVIGHVERLSIIMTTLRLGSTYCLETNR